MTNAHDSDSGWLRSVRGLGGCLALSAVAAAIGLAAPASLATNASLRLTVPSTVSQGQSFQAVASGTGTKKHNFLASFIPVNFHAIPARFHDAVVPPIPKCPRTFAAAVDEVNNGDGVYTDWFVHRKFNVTLLSSTGGPPGGKLRLCVYLYPRASGTAWAHKKPDSFATRTITST